MFFSLGCSIALCIMFIRHNACKVLVKQAFSFGVLILCPTFKKRTTTRWDAHVDEIQTVNHGF